MGIHDRDYYRDGGRGMFDPWGPHRATVWLIGLSVGVFFAQLFVPPVVGLGLNHPRPVLRGEVWRPVTALFLHAGLLPLFFNMLILYWTGSRMEERYGTREFVLFYLLAGTTANLAEVGLQAAGVLPEHPGLGAGPAVIAVLVLYAFHHPRDQVLLFFILPVPVFAVALLYVGLSVLGLLGGGGQAAAFFGAVFGAVYYQAGGRFESLLPRWPARDRRRAQPRLRVISPDPDDRPEPVGAAVEVPPRPANPPDEHFEAKVDAVLEKVSRYGQESLTAEEREILFRASEVYKRKRK